MHQKHKEKDGYTFTTMNAKGMYQSFYYPTHTIFPQSEIHLEGVKVPCPGKVKEYLESMYGYLGKDCYYNPDTNLYIKIGL